MKARYWSASARIEILARSTFCWRASASRRSSGPSKPSTSTTNAGSLVARSTATSASNWISSGFMRSPCVRSCRGFAGERGHGGCHRPHLIELAVAMEDQVAARCYRRARALLDRAGQGPHGDIVAHQQTAKSQPVPNHIPDQSDRSRGRSNRIDSRVYDMGGHPKREISKGAERGKIGGPQGFTVGLADGK